MNIATNLKLKIILGSLFSTTHYNISFNFIFIYLLAYGITVLVKLVISNGVALPTSIMNARRLTPYIVGAIIINFLKTVSE